VDTDLLRQLNNDIWHPFRLAYAKLDAPAFLDLHAPELIRAGGPAKQVFGFAGYSDQTEKWFAELADRGSSVTISFRFVERSASNNLASSAASSRSCRSAQMATSARSTAASTHMRDALTGVGASAPTTTPTNGQRRWRRISSPGSMSTTSRRSAHKT
jgi:hypothetical protein